MSPAGTVGQMDSGSPEYSKAQQTGARGAALAELRLLDLGFVVDRTQADFGIDLLGTLTEPATGSHRIVSPFEAKFQVKSTEQVGPGRIKIGQHRDYWRYSPLPVIGLWVALDRIYWCDLRAELRADAARKSVLACTPLDEGLVDYVRQQSQRDLAARHVLDLFADDPDAVATAVGHMIMTLNDVRSRRLLTASLEGHPAAVQVWTIWHLLHAGAFSHTDGSTPTCDQLLGVVAASFESELGDVETAASTVYAALEAAHTSPTETLNAALSASNSQSVVWGVAMAVSLADEVDQLAMLEEALVRSPSLRTSSELHDLWLNLSEGEPFYWS